MDRTEHTYITISKFLSMASASKILIDFYGENIPKEKMIVILKNLRDISNDYLYPKYALKNGFLEEINESKENEVESIGATYLMPEGTITEYKKELDHLADYDDKHWDDENGY